MDRLNSELKTQAITNGLCEEWQGIWKEDRTPEQLIKMMYNGLDFCLIHHWPSNDFIKQNFDLDTLRQNGVLVDDTYSLLNPANSLILGNSNAKIRYNFTYIGNVNVRDRSDVTLTAKGRSFVIVHLFDNASITAHQADNASIVIIKHSTNVHIHSNEGVKIREELNFVPYR